MIIIVFNVLTLTRQTLALHPRFQYNPFFFFLSTLLINHTETYLIFTQLYPVNQLNCLFALSSDRHCNLYAVDCRNHRVQRFDFQWTQTLALHPRFLYNPFFLFLSTLLINHTQTCLIFTQPYSPNQLICSFALSSDRHYNFYVVDCRNHRVQRFDIN